MGRWQPGEGLSFKALESIVCVVSLLAKSFVVISAVRVFLSDFSFSPCSTGDGPE